MIDFTDIFKDLKHTLKGKEDTFFLVNDKTNEIRQHFDENYSQKLNVEKFIDCQKSKQKYFNKLGINYGFFLIPDKSVVLRDYLPFDAEYMYRSADELGDVVNDLAAVITEEDFYKNDSFLSHKSQIKVVSFILSIFTDYDYLFYENLISSKLTMRKSEFDGDLFSAKNWSYTFDAYFDDMKYIEVDKLFLNDDITEISLNEVPEEFREFSSTKAKYFKNRNSLTNKKALVIYDAKMEYLIPVLLAYYEEVYFYRDYNYFNKQLIKWYEPDDVIELRIERFIETMYIPEIKDSSEILVPVLLSVDDIHIEEQTLHITIKGYDIRNIGLSAECTVFIDDQLFARQKFTEGRIDFKIDVENIEYGVHEIKLSVEKTKFTKSKTIIQSFKFCEDITKYFKGLKKTIKGKEDTFFLVNDSNTEIRQHYDCYFKSEFDRSRFIRSQISKITYFNKLEIPYKFFVVPDKSVLLKDYLPFTPRFMNRHVDSLGDYVIDLLPYLDVEDYLINDTHISMESSFKVVPQILSHFHGNTPEHYQKILREKLEMIPGYFKGNLLSERNWSYEYDEYHEKFKNIPVNEVQFPKSSIEIDSAEIPEEFRIFLKRPSVYIVNPDSISDKKALIFHGSSIIHMRPALSAYYREIFCYWDYSYFNKDIVEWFKPDIVFELRIERFLEKIFCPIITEENNVLMPVKLDLDNISVKNSILNIKLCGMDIRDMKLFSSCQVFIDDELVSEKAFDGYECEFNIDVSNYSKGEHGIRIFNKETKYTKIAELFEKITF